MYVVEIPNRDSPPAILLRESFRENGQVKNRTLANLSSWPSSRVEALRRLLRGELDNAAVSDPTMGPTFGVLHALKHIAAEIGIGSALGQSRDGKLGLFLVLARVAHQGSRLSAVRWARDHAVAEVLGLDAFDEEDLYGALDDLAGRQNKIETALWRNYLKRCEIPPVLFLYDVTSTYLEGEHNALGEFGYNRDGKRGKLQIVIGLLTDPSGEPLAVRVFRGNTADPKTVATQIDILTKQFAVQDVVFVGDRGMVKSTGKKDLDGAGFRYISALTDPQIRKLLSEKIIQMELFTEQVCEVEADKLRFLLRKNPEEARRLQHRLDDKQTKLRQKIAERNQCVEKSPRAKPEAGLRTLSQWISRHKLDGIVQLRLEGRQIIETVDPQAEQRAVDLAGCYVIVTDVSKDQLAAQAVHDSYVALQKVERDFRTMKTGMLEVRPVFVRKDSRTRGHVLCCMLALKLYRELERRLAAAFGTTDKDPHAVTVSDALAALNRLSLLVYDLDSKDNRAEKDAKNPKEKKDKLTVTRLPKPNEHQRHILDALRVPLPAK
jgi:Transposase DDE domain